LQIRGKSSFEGLQMTDFLETKDFSSAAAFLDYLQPRNPRWLPPSATDIPWIFRGQRNADWSLCPSSLREDITWFTSFKTMYRDEIKKYIEENPLTGEYQPDKTRLAELILHIAAEWDAVYEFVDLADKVGHLIPANDSSFWGGNKKRSWQKIAETIIKNEPSQHKYNLYAPELIEFALAQHHRIPTRLLDWSHSPFVAAFFAIEEVKLNLGSNKSMAVWAINYTMLDNTDLKMITHRKSKFAYLAAQSGVFIYDTLANFEYLKSGLWRSFEQVLKNKEDLIGAPILRKVTLRSSEVNELLRLLSVENITRAHIMPTFDNVTEALKMKRQISS
jgi:hypothetical protein